MAAKPYFYKSPMVLEGNWVRPRRRAARARARGP